jgi:hypothetical protein
MTKEMCFDILAEARDSSLLQNIQAISEAQALVQWEINHPSQG